MGQLENYVPLAEHRGGWESEVSDEIPEGLLL